MARVSIEDKFFSEDSRWRKLARLMGWTESEAIGHLVFLWHSSQDEEEYVADGDDICDWSRLEPGDDETKYLNAMAHRRVRYLDLRPDGKYIIRGNDKHIKVLRAYRDRAARTNKKREERKLAYLLESERGTLTSDVSSDSTTDDNGPRYTKANAKANAKAIAKANKPDIYIGKNSTDEEPAKKDPPCLDEQQPLFDEEKTAPKEKPAKKKTKARITTWSPDNAFASVFTLLNKLERYRMVFDVSKDTAQLAKYLDEYKISPQELREQVDAFVDYWQDDEAKLSKPRGRLTTWMGNFRDRKNERNARANNNNGSRPNFTNQGFGEPNDDNTPF